MNAKEELVEPEEVKQQQRDAQKFLCEFIEAYRDQPCLWKYASSDYRNRLVKERAYAGLVEKMREADPCADKDSVMRKINALRTAFRREYKKVRVAGKTGTRASSSYVPSLWYYDLMKFVVEEQDYTDVPPPGVAIVDWIEDNGEWTPAQQQQQQQPEAKNTAHADEALMDFIEDTTPSQVAVKVEQVSPVSSRPGSPRLVVAASTTATTTATVTTTTTTTTTPLAIEIDSVYSEKPPATHSRLEASAEPRTRAPKRLEQPGDLEHFAAYVVSKLKRSSPKQAIIAEKVIAEVLMRANLATLDESTGLTEPSKGPTAPS